MKMILIGALLCALTIPAFSDSKPTAEEIYAKYIQARGGQAKFDAVNTLIERGTYSENGQSFPAVQAKMRPYYRLVGDPDQPLKDGGEGYDGSAWEYYSDPGIVLRVVSDAAAALRHNSYIFGLLVDYKRQGSTITLIGTEKIKGRLAYNLRVHLRDNFEEDEFIDAESWLLVASRKVAKVHAFGNEVTSETLYSDYKPVEGILFPFLTRETDLKTGKELNRFVTSSYILNQRIDAAKFSPPDFAHTPLQSVMEKLYEQRDDPIAVTWTYADFRSAYEGVETDEAMRIIGYQMLKMKAYSSAIALLEANVRDYPQSSMAAFSLGRAYHYAGEDSKARTEYERALKLDPKNAKASDGLAELGRSR